MPLSVACLSALECGISVRYPLNAVAHCRTFPILGAPPDLLRRHVPAQQPPVADAATGGLRTCILLCGRGVHLWSRRRRG